MCRDPIKWSVATLFDKHSFCSTCSFCSGSVGQHQSISWHSIWAISSNIPHLLQTPLIPATARHISLIPWWPRHSSHPDLWLVDWQRLEFSLVDVGADQPRPPRFLAWQRAGPGWLLSHSHVHYHPIWLISEERVVEQDKTAVSNPR